MSHVKYDNTNIDFDYYDVIGIFGEDDALAHVVVFYNSLDEAVHEITFPDFYAAASFIAKSVTTIFPEVN